MLLSCFPSVVRVRVVCFSVLPLFFSVVSFFRPLSLYLFASRVDGDAPHTLAQSPLRVFFAVVCEHYSYPVRRHFILLSSSLLFTFGYLCLVSLFSQAVCDHFFVSLWDEESE